MGPPSAPTSGTEDHDGAPVRAGPRRVPQTPHAARVKPGAGPSHSGAPEPFAAAAAAGPLLSRGDIARAWLTLQDLQSQNPEPAVMEAAKEQIRQDQQRYIRQHSAGQAHAAADRELRQASTAWQSARADASLARSQAQAALEASEALRHAAETAARAAGEALEKSEDALQVADLAERAERQAAQIHASACSRREDLSDIFQGICCI